MTTYEKIQMLCRREGFAVSNIGDKVPGVKITRGAVSGWKKGAVPSAAVIKAVADYFGVSVDYLLDNETTPNLSAIANLFPIEKKKIPLLGDIACGKPIYADEDRESYVIAGTNVNADFCLRAKGDSMIGARILDGDIVFIQKADIVNNGEIAAVIIEDEVTLKRVYYYPESQKLVLNAENPKYEPLVYVDSELEQIHILGKAVAFQSDVR